MCVLAPATAAALPPSVPPRRPRSAPAVTVPLLVLDLGMLAGAHWAELLAVAAADHKDGDSEAEEEL